MRRLIAFPCDGDTLVGTLDEAKGTTGLLIVSGGSEVRSGAHRGMAALAARLAADGVPVLRFDRRGVGDSDGEDRGYAGSAADLAAAAAAFRAEAPRVARLVGFGNGDGATALALFGHAAGIDTLVLANPWVADRDAGEPSPTTAMRSVRRWWRMLTGALERPADDLARRVAAALHGRAASVVLATGDPTGTAYAEAARRIGLDLPTTRIATASHSFAGPGDAEALEAAIRAVLAA